jgi:hypothetical protein
MCWSHHSNVTWVLPNNMWLSFECVGSIQVCLNMFRSYLIICESLLYSGPHMEPIWTCVGPTWAYRQASFQPKSYIASCDLTYAGPTWLCGSYETHFDMVSPNNIRVPLYSGPHVGLTWTCVGPTWAVVGPPLNLSRTSHDPMVEDLRVMFM